MAKTDAGALGLTRLRYGTCHAPRGRKGSLIEVWLLALVPENGVVVQGLFLVVGSCLHQNSHPANLYIGSQRFANQ